MGFGLHLVGGFPKGILQGRVAPAWPDMRGALPLCTPLEQALRPAPGESLCGAGSPYAPLCRRSALHPGDFPVAGKVTKGAPGAAPLGTRWCEVSALFALAYASRRAGFCHCRRWICHFEVVRAIGCVVSFSFDQEKYSAFNPWRRVFWLHVWMQLLGRFGV